VRWLQRAIDTGIMQHCGSHLFVTEMVAPRCVLKYKVPFVSNGVSSCHLHVLLICMVEILQKHCFGTYTMAWFVTLVISYSVILLYGPGRIVKDEEIYTV